MTKRLDYPSKNKAHWGMIRQIPYLIFGKVWSYGIEFGCWQGRWRLVEKIVCPIYWQQSLWVSKEIGSVSLGTGGMLLWLTASLCAVATTEPLSNQKELHEKAKCFGMKDIIKNLILRLLLIINGVLIDLTVDNNSKELTFSFFLKKHRRTSTYIFAFQI